MPTPSEISRDWKTSRAYVNKCIKKGCPSDTFENARLWREAHARTRAPTHLQVSEEKEDDSPEARARRKEYFANRREGARLPQEPSDASLDQALFAVIEASEEASRLLQEAMIEGKSSKIAPLLSIHTKAVEARFSGERLYREELERRRLLIPLTEAQDSARQIFDVIIARLISLPQNVAPRANPQDPHRAMDVLEEAVGIIMEDAHNAHKSFLEKKK